MSLISIKKLGDKCIIKIGYLLHKRLKLLWQCRKSVVSKKKEAVSKNNLFQYSFNRLFVRPFVSEEPLIFQPQE